jgi:hypothetical protein
MRTAKASLKAVVMVVENRQSELTRLRNEQFKTLHDEVFGGLSPAERAEYEQKAKRIHKLEAEIQASAVAEQRREWRKHSEIDSHQDEAHNPYLSRERDSSQSGQRSQGSNKMNPERDVVDEE